MTTRILLTLTLAPSSAANGQSTTQARRLYVFHRDLWARSRGLNAPVRTAKQATTSSVLTGKPAK